MRKWRISKNFGKLPRDPAGPPYFDPMLQRSLRASKVDPMGTSMTGPNDRSTDEPETSKRHQKRLEVRQRPEGFGTQIGALQNCDMPLLQPYLKCVKKNLCVSKQTLRKKNVRVSTYTMNVRYCKSSHFMGSRRVQ